MSAGDYGVNVGACFPAAASQMTRLGVSPNGSSERRASSQSMPSSTLARHSSYVSRASRASSANRASWAALASSAGRAALAQELVLELLVA